MKKRTIIIAGLFVIVIGMMTWVVFQPKKAPASVTFVGYTNDAAGTRLATFVVSNCNSFVVRRQAGYWVEVQTPTGGRNRAGRWFSSSHDFNARGVEIVAVPVPTNQPLWRVLLLIRTDLGIVTEAMDTVRLMIFGFGATFRGRESYELGSVWMEN